MMRKLLTTGVLATAAAFAAPAYAAPTITFTPNVYTIPGYTTASVFQDFGNGAPNGTPFPSPNPGAGTGPVASQSSVGDVFLFQGTLDGIAEDPTPQPGNYLAIGAAVDGDGSYTITFNAPQQFFSFAFGTLDAYNTVTLLTTAGNVVLNGAAIVGAPVAFDGNGNSNVTGRVSYDFGGTDALLGVTFSSASTAFEIDSLAAAVPEPASWAMMIAGFGIVGGALRSTRRRKANLATA